MRPAHPLHARLILNGKAAGAPALRESVRVLREQGHTLEVRVTWEGGDAARYAGQAVREGVPLLVAAGGDGTVNEIVQGMLDADCGRDTSLGILPFGTANDFAQACRIPLGNPLEALQLLTRRRGVPVDVGQVNDRYFINMASGGFGAEVTSRTSADMKRLLGGAAYSVMGLVTAAKLAPKRVRLVADGREREADILVFAVGNGRQAGGGFAVTPHALLNDGLLDLMVVHDVEVAEFGRVLNELLDMRAEQNRYVHYEQLASFELHADQLLQLNLDGEPYQARSFHFQAHPGRLQCVLPAEAPLAGAAKRMAQEDKMTDFRMVHVATLDNPAVAELARIELEEAGIACQLEGTHQAGFTGVLPIRMFVPSPSAEKARRMLARHQPDPPRE